MLAVSGQHACVWKARRAKKLRLMHACNVACKRYVVLYMLL